MADSVKVKMKMSQILEITAITTEFMQEKGIPFKVSYWLGRNLDNLRQVEKSYRSLVQEKFEAEAVVCNDEGPNKGRKIIPPDKAEAFNVLINKEAEALEVEVDVFNITVTEEMEKIFEKVPGYFVQVLTRNLFKVE